MFKISLYGIDRTESISCDMLGQYFNQISKSLRKVCRSESVCWKCLQTIIEFLGTWQVEVHLLVTILDSTNLQIAINAFWHIISAHFQDITESVAAKDTMSEYGSYVLLSEHSLTMIEA